MSDINKEDVVQALGNLSVLEMIALTRQLEEKWGVKAEPAPVQLSNLPKQDSQESDQAEYDVILLSVPTDKKMNIIKLVRELNTLGLKESKELVEAAPKIVQSGLSKADAENLKNRLTEAGAGVEIK